MIYRTDPPFHVFIVILVHFYHRISLFPNKEMACCLFKVSLLQAGMLYKREYCFRDLTICVIMYNFLEVIIMPTSLLVFLFFNIAKLPMDYEAIHLYV